MTGPRGGAVKRHWAWPLVPLYAVGLAVNRGLRRVGVLRTRRLEWPVVSVGSLSAGGAGKTPVVIALAGLLRERGWAVDVLSRGYGRSGSGVERVDAGAEGAAARFGDEPVAMAQRLGVPVWVGADRFAAGQAAEETEKQNAGVLRSAQNDKPKKVHLLDDGFQHRGLARAMDVVVVTAEDLEDALLPAGNRREALRALRLADAVVVREEERDRVTERVRQWMRAEAPVWRLRRELRLADSPVELGARPRPLAFCGIARPEGFWGMLAQAGHMLAAKVAYSDHHKYGSDDVERLATVAGQRGATGFLTTEKDAVKLSAGMMERLRSVGPVCVVALDAGFVDEAEVVRELGGALPMKSMRVLIVRIGAMGDVLHAMPAVAALRVQHPEWFIGWAIEPGWSDLLPIVGDPNDVQQLGGRYFKKPLVDRWYRVPASEWKRSPLGRKTQLGITELRRVLREEQFDICVDMQGSLKSAVVGRMAKAPVFAGPAAPREKIARWLYTLRVELKATHVVEQGCELLSAAVGLALTPTRVRLPMEDADQIWAREVVAGERFCLISAGGGWGAKVWPAERFGAVAAALGRAGVRSLVNARPGGSPEAERVAAASEGFARVLPCSVGQLIPLIRQASLVIGGDTGPLHLAAVLEKPVVGIYGPTDPARNGPYGTRQRVLRDESSTTSHKRLKEPEPGMLRIGVEEVAAAALEMLG